MNKELLQNDPTIALMVKRLAEPDELALADGPVTLESCGWVIPESRAPYPFLVSRRTARAELTEGVARANFAIGEPVVSPEALTQQRSILLEPERREIFPEERPLVSFLRGWVVDTLTEHSSRYSQQGGNIEARERVIDEVGNKAYRPEEVTLITGGVHQAWEHILSVLRQSTPEKTAPSVIDTRQKEFTKVFAQIAQAWKNGDYFVLIIQDSKLIPDEMRPLIRRIAAAGRMIIIDEVTQPVESEKSLGRDPVISDLVITLDNRRIAQATGVVGILGPERLVKSIQDRHTRLLGTPSSTQTDMLVLLSDLLTKPEYEGYAAELRTLSEADIAQIPTPNNHQFMQDLVRLLKYGLHYLEGDDHALTYIHELTKRRLYALEAGLEKFHEQYFPAETTIVVDGGARGGLVASYKYLRDFQGVDTIIVPKPMWPYDDLELVEGLEYRYIDDAYFVKDRQGTIITIDFDVEKIKSSIIEAYAAEKKAAIVLNSGAHNPTGVVTPWEVKSGIVQLAKEAGFFVIDDATYLDETFDYKDQHTYSQAASGVGYDGVITVSSATKDWVLPGQRSAGVSSRLPGFYRDMQLSKEREQKRHITGMNSLAVIMWAALAAYPERVRSSMDKTTAEARRRIGKGIEVCDKHNVAHTIPQGALYLLCEDPSLRGEDPIGVTFAAADQGVGFLPVREALGGGPNWTLKRLAFAGRIPDLETLGKQMEWVIEVSWGFIERQASARRQAVI